MTTLKSVPENQGHRYVVLESCIRCAACWEKYPQLFISHHFEAYAYVHQQPKTKQEQLAFKKAEKLCPVKAIVDIDSYESF